MSSSTGILLHVDSHLSNVDLRDPQAGGEHWQKAANGQALSSVHKCLEFRRLNVINEDHYGFFIANGTLAPLSINGVLTGLNTVAGPLPDFAVIEAEDFVFFWWCTGKGVKHLPDDLPLANVRIVQRWLTVLTALVGRLE